MTLKNAAARRYGMGALIVCAALAAVAVAWQHRAGTPAAVAPSGAAPDARVSREPTPALRSLAEQAAAVPTDPDAWARLGRAYLAARWFPEAAQALAQATQLRGDDAQLWLDRAAAVGATQGERLSGEPEDFVRQALEIDPRHPNALAMAGLAASERGDASAAADHWRRALDVAPPDSPLVETLQAALAGVRAGAALPEAAPGSAAAEGSAMLLVALQLDPALRDRTRAGDALFIEVRLADRPGVVVASARRRWEGDALALRLDDAHSLDPAFPLSQAAPVVVRVHLSRSGVAQPESGDVVGESTPTAPQGRVVVRLDRVQR